MSFEGETQQLQFKYFDPLALPPRSVFGILFFLRAFFSLWPKTNSSTLRNYGEQNRESVPLISEKEISFACTKDKITFNINNYFRLEPKKTIV